MRKMGLTQLSGPTGNRTGQKENLILILQGVVIGIAIAIVVFLVAIYYPPDECIQRCRILTQEVWEENVALQRVCPCECVWWCTN